jgi:hypothetical protein
LVHHGIELPDVVAELDRLLALDATQGIVISSFGYGAASSIYTREEWEPSNATAAFAVPRLLKIVAEEERDELDYACVVLAEIAQRRPEWAPEITPAIVEVLSNDLPDYRSSWRTNAGKHLGQIAKVAPDAAIAVVPQLRAILLQLDRQGADIAEANSLETRPEYQRRVKSVLESLAASASASPQLLQEIAFEYLTRLREGKSTGPFAPLVSPENPDVTRRIVTELLNGPDELAAELHSVALAIRNNRTTLR